MCLKYKELEHWYLQRTSCRLGMDHKKYQQVLRGILKEILRSRRIQQRTFNLLRLVQQSFLLFHKHIRLGRDCNQLVNFFGFNPNTCQWGMHTFCNRAKLAILLHCKLENNSSILKGTLNPL